MKYARFPVADRDISEEYDLVIVGGGISGLAGLSAAHFYRTAFGANQRILISTIRTISAGTPSAMNSGIAARTYIGCGGTLGIATLYPYSYAPKARSYGAIFARAAVTGTARKDLIRLHGKNPDHVRGLSEEDMRTGLELSEVSPARRQNDARGASLLSWNGRPQ